MKVTTTEEWPGTIMVVLSRRNLLSLLAKLDGHPPDSACTIFGGTDADGYAVRAEEDDEHYAGRAPGTMSIDTEVALLRPDDAVSHPMRYRLAVLTHGSSAPLAATLASFSENVFPAPVEIVVFYDGPAGQFGPRHVGTAFDDLHWKQLCGGAQRGFCQATRRLWTEAKQDGPQFVFWLEQDFEFERPVDLRALATVLTENPQLAQVSLMRGAVNQREKDAGGLFELHRGDFVRQVEPPEEFERDPIPWLEHSLYFTTNPSLMLRSFMVAHPWPTHRDQCEGKFGIYLREQGFRFGVMGDGEPWVRHTAKRAGGFGY